MIEDLQPAKPFRSLLGLKRAALLPSRPACIPPSRPRGAKAAGLRFERALASSLKGCLHGAWFEFEDLNGFGYCQTDIIMPFLPHFLAVIEVKYTFVPGAHSKLANLYLPIAEKAFGAPAVGVVVVKNLDPRFRRGRIYTNLWNAAMASRDTGYPTLIQWAGQALLNETQRAKPFGTSEATPPAALFASERPTEGRVL
jgi:hypothetical protein